MYQINVDNQVDLISRLNLILIEDDHHKVMKLETSRRKKKLLDHHKIPRNNMTN